MSNIIYWFKISGFFSKERKIHNTREYSISRIVSLKLRNNEETTNEEIEHGLEPFFEELKKVYPSIERTEWTKIDRL